MVARWLEFLVGITLMAFGVALTIYSSLGTTPNSSLAAALSPITGLSVGMVTIIMNGVYVLLQILLLRRRYQWIQVLQFFTGLVFGVLIDIAMFLTSSLQTDNYLLQWVLALIGILVMGIGIGLQVHANVINLPGEGLVLALTAEARRICGARKGIDFGTMKILSDLSHVLLAVILSLAFLGRVEGVREATIVAAFALGIISRATLRRLPTREPPIITE